jgi:NADH:ubiquinone oxidoreductase subunit 4 (subunit M)
MNQILTFYSQNILYYTTMIPMIGILILLFIDEDQKRILKIIALHFSCLPFISFLFMWGGFNKSVGIFQFVTQILWIPVLNLNITFGIDGKNFNFNKKKSQIIMLFAIYKLKKWNIAK